MLKKELMSMEKTYQKIGIGRRKLKKLVECGDIDAVNINPSISNHKRYMFEQVDIENYIEKSKKFNKKQ